MGYEHEISLKKTIQLSVLLIILRISVELGTPLVLSIGLIVETKNYDVIT